MLRNYFKVAIRFLLRYKEYTIINIMGLAVGVICCLLIMLFVRSEFSYDKFNTKADNLYRVWQHEKADGQDFINPVTPIPLAPALASTFPEVVNTCRVFAFTSLMKTGNNLFSDNITMVDSTLFKMFDFKLLAGDKNNPFPTVNAVILTPAAAKKYFGNGDAVGKTIEMQFGDDKMPFTVAGIAESAPEESSIKYNVLISSGNAKYLFRPRAMTSWFNIFCETYVQLKDNATVASLDKKLPAMMKQQLGQDYGKEEFTMHLQPLTKIHLDTTLPAGIQPTSNPKYTYILSTIGILIWLCCMNRCG